MGQIGMNSPLSTSAARDPNSTAQKSFVIELANQSLRLTDEKRLREGIRTVLMGEGLQGANISLAVVDDSTIQEINRRFLNHDRPTDVLSFTLQQGAGFVEGEIIVSADTAAQSADRFGWTPDDELLLYAIHGALHLVGYDDQSAVNQTAMRQREIFYLNQFGLSPRYEERKP
jgi:probable rRNA maturation factor